jgi:hypothetical protein
MAGITMSTDSAPGTGVFTNHKAPEIDVSQYTTGQGRCLYALRNREIYRIDSMADEDRWPEFAREAAARGIQSTLSLPIFA